MSDPIEHGPNGFRRCACAILSDVLGCCRRNRRRDCGGEVRVRVRGAGAMFRRKAEQVARSRRCVLHAAGGLHACHGEG